MLYGRDSSNPPSRFIEEIDNDLLEMTNNSIKEEKVIKKVPIAGAVLSVLMIAGWTTVYVLGWIGL